MAYTDHYKLADDVIAHLNTIIGGVADPFLVSRYVGFIAVASVTVYELAVKEIFIEFAEKKHKILAEVTRKNFDRINGKIKTSIIRDEYVSSFGDKYVQRFRKKLDLAEKASLRSNGISILSSYGNVVTWRNQFAHEGQIPSNATYNEITKSYQAGKEVIKCLAETMYR
jgi:hypothetical protein